MDVDAVGGGSSSSSCGETTRRKKKPRTSDPRGAPFMQMGAQMAPWQSQVMQVLSDFVERDADHMDLPKGFPLGGPQMLLLRQLAPAQNAVVVMQSNAAYLRRIKTKVARAGPFGAIKGIVKRHGGRMSVRLCVAVLESAYEDEKLLLEMCGMLGTWHQKLSLMQLRKQFKKAGLVFDKEYEWMALRGKRPGPESSSESEREGPPLPRHVVEVFAEDDAQVRSTLRLLRHALDEDTRRRERRAAARPDGAEDELLASSVRADGLPWWGDAPADHPLPSRAHARRAQVAKRKLPAYEMRDVVTEAMEQYPVVVVVGATGCGKSTQLPIAWYEWRKASNPEAQCKVICCQPRKIAAVSLAERVALENGQAVGGLVGYKIRFETKASRDTDVLYCTTGVLLRAMVRNPTLEGVSCVFLDEIHERDTLADFTMTVLRDVVQTSRPDLKIVLMSATVDPQWCLHYFQDCHTVDLPGDTPHRVEWNWLEDCLELTGHTPKPPAETAMNPDEPEVLRAMATLASEYHDKFSAVEAVICAGPEWIDYDLVTKLVEHIDSSEDDSLLDSLEGEGEGAEAKGAVLIFMPGMGEIRKCIQALQGCRRCGKWVPLPLHSTLSQREQQKVFERPPKGMRKIVVTTNIAETSITIDDVVYVIDSGRERLVDLNPETNISSLMVQWIARSNACQRKGRAGRCRSGSYFALYSSVQHAELFLESHPPEMQRTQVETLCLQVKALGFEDIEATLDRAPDPPDKRTVEAAKRSLVTLGALKEDGALTRLGRLLMALPVHPQIGKFLLYSRLLDCTDAALTIAAAMDVGRVFTQGGSDRRRQELGGGLRSDHWVTVQAYRRWARLQEKPEEQKQLADRLFLNQKALEHMAKLRVEFLRNLEELEGAGRHGRAEPPAKRAVPLDATDELTVISAALASSLHLARLTPQLGMVCLSIPPCRATVAPKSVNALKNLLQPELFEEALAVWFNRLQTSDLFVEDTTFLRAIHVLLLGPPLSVQVSYPEYAQVQPPETGEDAAEVLKSEKERRRAAAERRQRREQKEQRKVARIRALVEQLYEEHNPSKLPEVEQMFKKYAGVESDMYLRICAKYDTVPDPGHLPSEDEEEVDEQDVDIAARQLHHVERHVPWLRCSSPDRMRALLEIRKVAIELFDRFVGTSESMLPKVVADALGAFRKFLVAFGSLGDLRMRHHKDYGFLEEYEQIPAPMEEEWPGDSATNGTPGGRRLVAPVAKAKGKANVAKAAARKQTGSELDSWVKDPETMLLHWLEGELERQQGALLTLEDATSRVREYLGEWLVDLPEIAVTPEFVDRYHAVIRLGEGLPESVELAQDWQPRGKPNGHGAPGPSASSGPAAPRPGGAAPPARPAPAPAPPVPSAAAGLRPRGSAAKAAAPGPARGGRAAPGPGAAGAKPAAAAASRPPWWGAATAAPRDEEAWPEPEPEGWPEPEEQQPAGTDDHPEPDDGGADEDADPVEAEPDEPPAAGSEGGGATDLNDLWGSSGAAWDLLT